MTAHEAVRAYWDAAEARDWEAFGRLLAADVVYQGPQTRERVCGREAYVRFNVEGFPGAWHVKIERIVGEADQAVSWIEFTGESGTQPGICFFRLDAAGRISEITDFWPDPYDLPDSRAHLVDRY